MRSSALSGIALTSTAAPAPEPSASALVGRRRPFNRISTLRSLKPRILMLVVPEPEGELALSSPWSLMSMEARLRTSSATLVAPVRSISFLL
ncbi:hypothetical protein D3C72_1834340 [compost metagenome]